MSIALRGIFSQPIDGSRLSFGFYASDLKKTCVIPPRRTTELESLVFRRYRSYFLCDLYTTRLLADGTREYKGLLQIMLGLLPLPSYETAGWIIFLYRSPIHMLVNCHNKLCLEICEQMKASIVMHISLRNRNNEKVASCVAEMYLWFGREHLKWTELIKIGNNGLNCPAIHPTWTRAVLRNHQSYCSDLSPSQKIESSYKAKTVQLTGVHVK